MRTLTSRPAGRSTAAGMLVLVLGPVLATADACSGGGDTGMGGGTNSSSASSGAPSSSSSSSGTGGTSPVSSSSSTSSSSGGAPCTNVLQGSFTIQNTTDIATVTPYCGITGDLNIQSTGLATISLPALATIGGQLNLQANGLGKLSLPALATIGSRLLSWSGQMDELDLPALTSVNSIELPLTLNTLTAPNLASVPAGLDMIFEASSIVSFPALVSVGPAAPNANMAFHVRGGASLSAPLLSDCKYVALGGQTASVDLPALTTLEVLGNCFTAGDCPAAAAPTITMNALTSVTQIALMDPGTPSVSLPNVTTIGSGTISANSLSAPALVTFGDPMALSTLAAVSTVDLSALKTVHNLTVKNTSLASLDLPALISGDIVFGSHSCPMFGMTTCSADPQLLQVQAPSWTSGSVFFGDSTFPACRAGALCAQLGINPAAASCWCSPSPPCSQATSPCP